MGFREYLIFQKFLQNNRAQDIEFYIDQAVVAATDQQIPLYQLSSLDKTVIMLLQRIISVGNTVTYTVKEQDATKNIQLDLASIVDQLVSADIEHTRVISCLGREYILGVPFTSRAINTIEFAYSTLKYINTGNGDGSIPIRSLTITQRDKALEELPASIVTHLTEYAETIESQANKITLHLPLIEEPINLSFQNGILTELTKILCRSGLVDVYRKIYALASGPGLSVDSLNLLAPAEVDLLYSFLEEEAREMEKNNKSKEPGLPLPYASDTI